MAKVPKILANYAERRGFRTRVVAVDDLSPALLRMAFEGDALRSQTFSPCDATAFRVDVNDFRHYTPETVDTDHGRATILFHRHHGPGAPGMALIDSLEPGGELTWCGMGSARAFRWSSPAAALALGDATTVGLMVALSERARAEGREFLGVVEIDHADRSAVVELLPGAIVLKAEARPGAALDAWLSAEVPSIAALAPECVYLAGHGQSIQRQRHALQTWHGLDRRVIRTQPYWATGKTGL